VQAVCRLLRQAPRQARAASEVGGGEQLGQVWREKCEQVARFLEAAPLVHPLEPPPADDPPAPAPRLARLEAPALDVLDERDL